MQHTAAEAGAVGKHHVVEQRAFTFLDGIHLGADARKLAHVKMIEFLEITQHPSILLIVRPAVMIDGFHKHILEHQRRGPALRRNHHGTHACEVSLQCNDHQITHDLNVFITAHCRPKFFRLLKVNVPNIHLPLGDTLDLLLHSTYRVHIIVELVAVESTEFPLQIFGIGQHKIEYAAVGAMFLHIE